MNTFYGIKQTMNQVWTKSGKRLPITVVKAEPVVVTQVKTTETDGYESVQIGIGARREKTTTKPVQGHLKKAGVSPRYLREVTKETEVSVGDSVSVQSLLKVGDIVSVTGFIKGRGFAGAMKRHGFHGGPKTHGQSDRWRAVGSIGQGTTPGRVHKGKRMAGHYGVEKQTTTNLRIVFIDESNQTVWIAGTLPGATGSLVRLSVTGESEFEGLREQSLPKVVASEPESLTEVANASESTAIEPEKETEAKKATEEATETKEGQE